MADIIASIVAERVRQQEKWGEQNHPDGTGQKYHQTLRNAHQARCKENARNGTVSFFDILIEEVYEAAAENNRAALRKELIQVAAVCVQWCQKIDRQQGQYETDRQAGYVEPPGACL